MDEPFNNFGNSGVNVEVDKILKDNVKSIEYQNKGNEYCLKKEFIQAIIYYNKSIAFVQNDPKLLSDGYANRLGLQWQLERYLECLNDIKLSKQLKWHYNEKIEALMKLEDRCKEKIINLELTLLTLDDKNQLTKCTYQDYPLNIDLMKPNKNHETIKTKIDLKVGDIVTIEKPLAAVASAAIQYAICANCLKETFSLIPCPSCTSVMFCSRKCLKIAYISFHKYECNVIDYLFSGKFTFFSLLVLRIFFQAISWFNEDIDQLIKFEKSKVSDKNTMIIYYIDYNVDTDDDDTDESDEDHEDYVGEIIEKKYYQCYVLSRYAKFAKQKLNDTQIQLMIELLSNMFKIQTEKHKRFIKDYLCSVHVIAKNCRNISRHYDQVTMTCLGIAIYPSCRYMKHSCAPNITRIFNGSIMTGMIIRPIKSGEPLYEAYRDMISHYVKKDKRQNILKSIYNIDCKCEACSNDFKIWSDLEENPEVMSFTCEILPENHLKTLVEQIKTFFFCLNTFSTANNYPCKELQYWERLLTIGMMYFIRNTYVNNYKKVIKFSNDQRYEYSSNETDNGEATENVEELIQALIIN